MSVYPMQFLWLTSRTYADQTHVSSFQRETDLSSSLGLPREAENWGNYLSCRAGPGDSPQGHDLSLSISAPALHGEKILQSSPVCSWHNCIRKPIPCIDGSWRILGFSSVNGKELVITLPSKVFLFNSSQKQFLPHLFYSFLETTMTRWHW